MSAPALRSFLYVPATQPDRFAKAVRTGAHAVIVDLEDAVAPEHKDRARLLLRQSAASLREACDEAGCQFLVRINARASAWYGADLEACVAAPIDGIVVPKPDDADAIAEIATAMQGRGLYLLVESLAGFRNIEAISRVPGVRQLMFGAADLMLDVGTGDDNEPLHYFRSLIVMHSRLAKLPAPVDGVCVDLQGDARMDEELARARRFGFGAKLCVHPRQVEPIHRGFRPGAEEIAWARRVVEIAGGADGAAVKVDGRLVDAPILEQARRVLRAAG